MPFTNYTDTALLNAVFAGAAGSFGTLSTAPQIWVALANTTPTQDGNVSNFGEPSGGSYARVSLNGNSTNWNAATNASPSYATNKVAVNFATATAGWCGNTNLTYVGFFDGSTVGGNNLLMYGQLSTPKPVLNGDTASFAAAAINISLN